MMHLRPFQHSSTVSTATVQAVNEALTMRYGRVAVVAEIGIPYANTVTVVQVAQSQSVSLAEPLPMCGTSSLPAAAAAGRRMSWHRPLLQPPCHDGRGVAGKRGSQHRRAAQPSTVAWTDCCRPLVITDAVSHT
jgi:hypothetical protein